MKISKLKYLFFQISGVGNPIIFVSFIWYVFNAIMHVYHGLDFKTGMGGFQNIESFFAYSLLLTYVPHALCMEKGKHDFLGNTFMTDVVIVSVVFFCHSGLSFSIITGSGLKG